MCSPYSSSWSENFLNLNENIPLLSSLKQQAKKPFLLMVPPKSILSLKQILCQKSPNNRPTLQPTQMPPVFFVAKNKPTAGQENVSKKVWKRRVSHMAQNGGLQYHGLSLPFMLLWFCAQTLLMWRELIHCENRVNL